MVEQGEFVTLLRVLTIPPLVIGVLFVVFLRKPERKLDARSAAATGGEELEFATSKGMEQFGCCPKTSGGPGGRRVLFGWINNGVSHPPPHWLSAASLPPSLPMAGRLPVDTLPASCA